MTPSQQTIQLIRDAIVSGNLQDAEKALEGYCCSFYVFGVTTAFMQEEKETRSLNEIYQLFNQSK